MSSTRPQDAFPFELAVDRSMGQTRRDPSGEPSLVGYEDVTSDETFTFSGDKTAVFAWALGRASSDATLGAVAVEDGEPQKILTDELGRIWTRSVPGVLADEIQGNVSNDAADGVSKPVKVGGIAVADFSGQAVVVAVGDRVNAAFDRNGRQLVVPQGNVAHDAIDVGQPVKVGGRAAASGGFAAVAVDDRSDLAVDVNGRLLVNVDASTAVGNIQGNIANDAPDAGSFPVKVGGRAVANGTVGAAVTAGDRADAVISLNGALHVLTSPNPITDATSYAYSVLAATVGDATGRLVVKASPGRVRRILVANNALIQLFAQIHNAIAVGDIATARMLTPGLPIPAGGFGYLDFSEADLACSIGIAVALSTTQLTYTAAAVTGQFSGQFA